MLWQIKWGVALFSIVSNIADGSARGSEAEHRHFLSMAQWSCMELATQIYASDFGYIQNLQRKEELISLPDEVVNMLYTMIHK